MVCKFNLLDNIHADNEVVEERVRLQAQIDASEHVKLQLDHMHKLLSYVLRLPSNEHKLWKAKFPQW